MSTLVGVPHRTQREHSTNQLVMDTVTEDEKVAAAEVSQGCRECLITVHNRPATSDFGLAHDPNQSGGSAGVFAATSNTGLDRTMDERIWCAACGTEKSSLVVM